MAPTLPRRHMPRALPSLLCSVLLMSQALSQALAPALAQPTPDVRRPDPLDPKATVPALRYESAIAQYRRLSDEKTVSWRDANDTVARIGGWRVYAREAQQADPPASASASASAPTPPVSRPPAGMPADTTQKPTPAGHGGHKQP